MAFTHTSTRLLRQHGFRAQAIILLDMGRVLQSVYSAAHQCRALQSGGLGQEISIRRCTELTRYTSHVLLQHINPHFACACFTSARLLPETQESSVHSVRLLMCQSRRAYCTCMALSLP